MHAPFQLIAPTQPDTAVVFASPHSSRDYPADLLERSVLDLTTLRSSEDAYVDDLVADGPRFGAPLLLGGVPRAYVDFNRASCELDPALIADIPVQALNPRIASGLGVIPRVVTGARAIYRGKLPLALAQARIAHFWHPYHAALKQLLADQRSRFGQAILFDMHSMPHEAVIGFGRRGQPAPQVVLGNRFGASCSAALMDQVEAVFTSAGLRVSRNTPFAGAFVAQHYGRPAQKQHVVQIEIDRALYLDEARVRPAPGYGVFRQRMAEITAGLAAIGRAQPAALTGVQPLAAE